MYGKVSLRDLEELCTREDLPEVYVPKFRNNFAQMKIDGVKTYGKVFEDDGNEIKIWSEIEAVLMEYKSDFCE